MIINDGSHPLGGTKPRSQTPLQQPTRQIPAAPQAASAATGPTEIKPIIRKSLGINDLDNMVEGGVKDGSITLLEGSAGSGKSTLAMHFIKAGLDAGEKAMYMSVEEEQSSFMENMGRFGFEIRKHQDLGNFLFMELNAQRLKDFISKGTLGIEDILATTKVNRIVIDSISAFTMLYPTESEQRLSVQKLFEKLRKWKLTTLIVAEDSGSSNIYGLRYLVDGVMKLSYLKIGRERVRTIEILKMRATNHLSTEVIYRIEAKGIRLYPGEKVLEG